jgi:DNA-binding protein YbaB
MEQLEQLRTTQKLGSQTSQLLHELRNTVTADGYSYGNAVKAVVDGTQRVKSVEFVDETFLRTSEPYEVSSAVVEAIHAAHAKATEKMEDRLRIYYKGLGLWS